MNDLDKDRIELLERQLADRVTERVRPALFRLYAAVGLTVISVLGFVGWDIVTDIKASITRNIETEIKEKRTEIIRQMTETDFMAERAGKIISDVEKRLEEFQRKANALDETIKKVDDLKASSQNLMAIYSKELEPALEMVKSLPRQLQILAKQVDQINTIASTARPGAGEEPSRNPQQRTSAINSVISQTAAAEKRLLAASKKVTVFFQFAGSSRAQAGAISAALKAKGYIIPGEDRESGAAYKHEVRYFHDEDKDSAQRFADDTTRALRNLGYTEEKVPDIRIESLVTYPGKKPRMGVFELWLDIPVL